MTWTNTNTQPGFPLFLFLHNFCQTYLTAAGTRRRPTLASPPSTSPVWSTTPWNTETSQQHTAGWKKRWWCHQHPSAQSNRTRKAEHSEKRCLALNFFFMQLPAAADALSSLNTVEKRGWHSEKKCDVDTGPKKATLLHHPCFCSGPCFILFVVTLF